MKKVFVISGIILLLGTLNVFAQHRGCIGEKSKPGCGQGHGDILKHAQDLNMTDEQVAKIKDITIKFQKSMIDFNAEVEKLKLSIKQEMHSESPDRNNAITLTANLSKIKAQLAQARVNHKFDVNAVLSAEQLIKVKEKMKTQRFGGGMGHGKKGCMPDGHPVKKGSGHGVDKSGS